MVFPRWLWWFIPGLFLNPLTFVLPKYNGNMGCICVNGTNMLHATNNGAPNSQIPNPGTPGCLDKNWTIAYGTALQQFLMWLYNMHLDWMYDDILMLPDNISTAFHQLFYHPQMMPVFASIFENSFVSQPEPSLGVAAPQAIICSWANYGLGLWGPYSSQMHRSMSWRTPSCPTHLCPPQAPHLCTPQWMPSTQELRA